MCVAYPAAGEHAALPITTTYMHTLHVLGIEVGMSLMLFQNQ